MARELLGPDFERRVGDTIAVMERSTAAEVVLVVAPRAGRHRDVPLVMGIAALLLTFTVVVFVEEELGGYTVYAAPLAAFFAVYVATALTAGLFRPLLGHTRRAQSSELWARATFQKAGLHRTRDGTAVLVFLPILERRCVIVRDHGVAAVVGDGEWSAFEGQFDAALASASPADGVVGALQGMGKVLGERLPPRPDDVDELPSNVRVTFG